MASVQEFKKLREISLAEGEVDREKPDVREENKSLQNMEHDNEDERKLKSNSLKRFFRMSHKKKTGEEDVVDLDKNQVELDKGEINLETEIQNSTQIGDASDSAAEVDNQESKVEFKRFKLHFGGIKSNPKSSESSKELAASFSRLTLKSSLSNYWNSVFKQKKNRKSSKATEIDEDQENSNSIGDNENSNDNDLNFEEKVEIEEAEKTFVITPKENHRLTVVDNILSEEIHSLKISEENVLE